MFAIIPNQMLTLFQATLEWTPQKILVTIPPALVLGNEVAISYATLQQMIVGGYPVVMLILIATVMVQCTERIAPDAVFIPFHFHECVNRITLGLLDPHSRQPAYKQCAVTVEPIADQKAAAKENVEARAF